METNKSHPKKLQVISIVILCLCSAVVGGVISRVLPSSFLEHPILTWKVMQQFPQGTMVVPNVSSEQEWDKHELKDFWLNLGFSPDQPAKVVDFETIRFGDHEKVNPLIRTHRGSGFIVCLSDTWLTKYNPSK